MAKRKIEVETLYYCDPAREGPTQSYRNGQIQFGDGIWINASRVLHAAVAYIEYMKENDWQLVDMDGLEVLPPNCLTTSA